MNRRGYASRTQVPVSKTRGEVEDLLTKSGASGFVFGQQQGSIMLMFEMKDRRLRFVVPMPVLNKSHSNQNEVDRETRRRWRAILLILKAKLEAVSSKVVEFDEEFLAHIVIQGSTTVGDQMVPQMKEALATGKLPPLLPAGPS